MCLNFELTLVSQVSLVGQFIYLNPIWICKANVALKDRPSQNSFFVESTHLPRTRRVAFNGSFCPPWDILITYTHIVPPSSLVHSAKICQKFDRQLPLDERRWPGLLFILIASGNPGSPPGRAVWRTVTGTSTSIWLDDSEGTSNINNVSTE